MTQAVEADLPATSQFMARMLLVTLGALSEMYDCKDGPWVDELRDEAAAWQTADSSAKDPTAAELEDIQSLLRGFRSELSPCTSCMVGAF